jgi:hypothetical protein
MKEIEPDDIADFFWSRALTGETRQAIDDHVRLTVNKAGPFLFADRGNPDRGLTSHQWSSLVADITGNAAARSGLDTATSGKQ